MGIVREVLKYRAPLPPTVTGSSRSPVTVATLVTVPWLSTAEMNVRLPSPLWVTTISVPFGRATARSTSDWLPGISRLVARTCPSLSRTVTRVEPPKSEVT